MFGERAIYHDGWIASSLPFRAPGTGLRPIPRTSSTTPIGSCMISPRTGPRATTLPRPIPRSSRTPGHVLDRGGKVSGPAARRLGPHPLHRAPARASSPAAKPIHLPARRHAARNAPSILNKSFSLTAEIEVPEGGAEGAGHQGGRFAGWGLYLLKGKPVFVYNLSISRGRGSRRRTRSRRASTPSTSSSPTMDRASAKAGLA